MNRTKLDKLRKLRKIENEKRALAALCECILRCHKKLMPASTFSSALVKEKNSPAVSPH